MQRTRLIVTLSMALALLATGVSTTNPQAAEKDCEYFGETGHWVCDEFLEFFRERGGLEIFGYPLTEAFEDPSHANLRVQYFQRARLEWHPGNPAPYQVQLGLLVDELGYDFPPVPPEEAPSSDGPLHRYFPRTQHVVSYAFLDYFLDHGGLDIFGYPRSEFMYESGRIVQYFQRARLAWYPESPVGSQMQLTNLGEIYLEQFELPGDYDDPVPPSARPGESLFEDGGTPSPPVVTRLEVSASVSSFVTGRRGTQTLFVYVNDQQGNPRQGASVTAVARYPSRHQDLELPLTDENGFAKVSFEILPTPPGRRVVIDVTVTYEDVEGTTQTFFLPWW
jgi:hypothetical protein